MRYDQCRECGMHHVDCVTDWRGCCDGCEHDAVI